MSQFDYDYIVIGGHVDNMLQEKIMAGAYVDFCKLLPKDRITSEEDNGRMDLVVRNGKAFWIPISDGITINTFSKWEQAFRVFSNIYTRTRPERAGQLIEYNHIIHTISQTFTWENVYAYDREFRLHMARHPEYSWAIILQQAWSMKLRDRVFRSEMPSHNSGYSGQNNSGKGSNNPNDYCKRFNKGICNLGRECANEHCCSYCHKFGHGVIVCRKLIFDKEKSSKRDNKNQQ